MEAICLASSRVMFLLVSAAPLEAGSWKRKRLSHRITSFQTYLVLAESSNLGIGGLDRRASNTSLPNSTSVALQSTVDKSSGHAVYITGSLGIGECLVCGGLLQAIFQRVSEACQSWICIGAHLCRQCFLGHQTLQRCQADRRRHLGCCRGCRA